MKALNWEGNLTEEWEVYSLPNDGVVAWKPSIEKWSMGCEWYMTFLRWHETREPSI